MSVLQKEKALPLWRESEVNHQHECTEQFYYGKRKELGYINGTVHAANIVLWL